MGRFSRAAGLGVWIFLFVFGAVAQEPKEAVRAGIQKLRQSGNYSWSVTTTAGAGDSTPQFFVYPAVRGRIAGGVASLAARSAAGEVELLKKGEKRACRIRMQWKTPEELRQAWLQQTEADLKAGGTNTAAALAREAEQIDPLDGQALYLGNDPTAVAGVITPLPPTMVGSGRRARPLPPRPGATMPLGTETNAPAFELPDAGTLTEMLLDALPDPLAEAETLLGKTVNLKPAGAGYYAGEMSPEFVPELAAARKRTGDNRPPQVSSSGCDIRFWVSQGSIYKYQTVARAVIIVGPTYNPLTVSVERTTTVEFRASGLTRVEVSPAAARLLQ